MKIPLKASFSLYILPCVVFLFLSCSRNRPTELVSQRNHDSLSLLLDSTEKVMQKDPNNTFQLIRQIQQTASDLQLKDILYKCLVQSGIFYSITENIDASDSCYQQAMTVYSDQTDSLMQARMQINVGLNQYKRGNFRDAIKKYDDANKLIEGLTDSLAQIIRNKVLLNTATCYSKMGVADSAFLYLIQSRKLAVELKDRDGEANALLNIGNTYQRFDDTKNAILYTQQALSVYQETGNTVRIQAGYSNLAALYDKAGMTREAEEAFEEAEKWAVKLNLKKQLGVIYHNKGIMMSTRERYPEALTLYNRSLEIKKEQNDTVGMVSNLINRGALYSETKQLNLSEADLLQALDLAKRKNLMKQAQLAAKQLTYMYSVKGDLNEADRFAKLNESIKDSIFSQEKYQVMQEMETKYEVEKKNLQLANQQRAIKDRNILLGILGALIIMSVTLIFVIVRFQQKKRKMEEQKQKSLENELQLRTLHSKVLPHFTKNVLTAIGHFAMDDNRKAGHYISQFSKFTHLTLANSDKNYNKLENELNYIETYLSLEKMRFDKRLEYTVSVGENVDVSVLIPAMALHTYCDNAIRHGIVNKSGEGNLNVTINRKDGGLSIQITDNGIGRKRSAELGTQGNQIGLQLIQQQLDFYNRLNDRWIVQTITDLEDEAGKSLGTTVELYIPDGYRFTVD